MVIFNVSGGLGNQFFQYAFGRYLAISHETDLYLRFESYKSDVSRSPKLGYFETFFKKSLEKDVRRYLKTYDVLHPFFKKLYLNKSNIHLRRYFNDRIQPGFNESFKKVKKGYFDGYWAYEEYFKEIRPYLLEELVLRAEYKTNIYKRLEMRLKSSNSVAVHIRRGDYISNKVYAGIMNSLSLDYYYKAIDLLASKKNNLSFYVFSDEIDWVKENLQARNIDIHFIDDPDLGLDYLEFSLMKSCNNFIIANSSFSWWAAWLSENKDKCIIAPKRWYKDDEMQHRYSEENHVPSNWIQL